MVEQARIELATSALQRRRSPAELLPQLLIFNQKHLPNFKISEPSFCSGKAFVVRKYFFERTADVLHLSAVVSVVPAHGAYKFENGIGLTLGEFEDNDSLFLRVASSTPSGKTLGKPYFQPDGGSIMRTFISVSLSSNI